MKKYIPILERTGLFAGLSAGETEAMCSCLGVKVRRYEKGSYVLRSGDEPGSIMILAGGRLLLQRDDYWGKRSILNVIEPGEMFGEAYVERGSGGLANDVFALESSEVLFFDARRVLTLCPNACSFHGRVVRNLFFAVCGKNRSLVSKMAICSGRSTREKLVLYLSEQARRKHSAEFSIAFDRQQLADFLGVERSAMSRELCRMRDEGLISFHRSRFVLHELNE